MSAPFLGEIKLFPWTWAPKGWALCNGSLVSLQQYTALFSLLGTYYGGDGVRTFGLPDLRGRTPVHQSSNYVMGEQIGVETVTLLSTQMPVHTHTLMGANANGTSPDPVGHLFANYANATAYHYGSDGQATATLNPTTVTLTGGSTPHENMQPFLVLNYCIAMSGIFPARN